MSGNERSPVDPSPLPVRMAVEAMAATVSAFTVAPAISIVDKAIVSNASGLEPLVPALINGVKSLFTNPVYFFRQPSFLFIWGVYSGTYIVANNIEAICERNEKSSFYPKFFGSSAANITLSILKDRAFARMFGKGDPRPMPTSSMALFGVRDSMTILASFSLPGIISTRMQERLNTEKSFSDTASQLITPVSMQILSTPLHLFGLDLYNRPEVSMSTRLQFIKQEYIKTTLARMSRIFPAFGIGGVVNKSVRKSGNEYLRELYGSKHCEEEMLIPVATSKKP
jgi:hypothetical protein